MDALTLTLVLLVPLVLLGPSIMIFLLLSRRLELERPGAAEGVPAERPWWGNPLLWLAFSVVSVLLGIFVAPQLFGGVILFLPFVWISSLGAKRRDAR